MTNLRQGRRLRSALAARCAPSLFSAALVGAGLLLPGSGFAAAPNTRARHPLPTALHASRVTDAGSQGSAKRHKAPSKGKAGARATDATSSASSRRRGSKRGKGRRDANEPADPPVPMYRAHRGAAPTGYEDREARNSGHGAHAGKHSHFAYGPAPLVNTRRKGKKLVEVARNTTPPSHFESLAHHINAAPTHVAEITRNPPPAPAPKSAARPQPTTTPASRPEVYAEGFSHPDDDERLPRDRAVLGEDAPPSTPAPVARVSATTTPLPASSAAPSTVVQGFGSEIAVPSTTPSDRPGGTRRRNHPSNWQPESSVMQPEPLEEREAITDAAVRPAVLPEIYDRNGRLVMPAPLKGSHDVLVHQNMMATNDGLTRILDDADLERLRAAHLLVSFPVSESLRLNEDLPYNRRMARPWTVAFATDLGRAFYGRFRQPLQVNSAVRTVHYQARLLQINGNAAGLYGDSASPHLTGQAIDLAKRGMSQAQLAWMRDYLLPLMRAGKIDVEEEFQQACFHVSVYRSYSASRHTAREYAQVRAPRPQPVQNDANDDQ